MPTKIKAPAKIWTRPTLVRLGKISDVAANTPSFCQAYSGSSGNCHTAS